MINGWKTVFLWKCLPFPPASHCTCGWLELPVAGEISCHNFCKIFNKCVTTLQQEHVASRGLRASWGTCADSRVLIPWVSVAQAVKPLSSPPCARQNEGHHHSLNFCILLSEGPVFILKSGILFSGFSSVHSFCSLSNVLLSTKFFYLCLKISVEGWDLITDTNTASHIMRLSWFFV